jgi:hypothetical protein
MGEKGILIKFDQSDDECWSHSHPNSEDAVHEVGRLLYHRDNMVRKGTIGAGIHVRRRKNVVYLTKE